MQKKYLYLTLAIFLCFAVVFASGMTIANDNACKKTLITAPTGGSPGTFHVGDTVSWNITVYSSNTSIPNNPAVMKDLIIYDNLPAGVTFVTGTNWSSSTATFSVIGTNLLKWDFGSTTLNGMPQAWVNFSVTINNVPANTVLTNTANWTANVYDVIANDWQSISVPAFDSIRIVKSPSTLTTALNVTSPIVMGTPFHDSATLGGHVSGYDMNNTATISFYYSTDDVNWIQIGSAQSAPSNGGTVNSADVTGLAVGTYHFKANYTGNTYYSSVTSADLSENLTITQAPSTTTTKLNATTISNIPTITLGGTVHDMANVTFTVPIGPYPQPAGTITFLIAYNSSLQWQVLSSGPGTWDPSTHTFYAISVDVTPNSTGYYYFNATYSGDGNYSASHDCYSKEVPQSEILHVLKAPTNVTTLLNATGPITLGQNVTDTATVTGGVLGIVPTGTVTFDYRFPNNGTWKTYDTETLSGGVATSKPFTPTQAGVVYYFNVTYNGDGNYSCSTSNVTSEHITANKATPTVNTALLSVTGAPITSIILGQGANDTATVTGVLGIVPTGTVTFSVQLPNGTLVTFDSNQPLVAGSATSTAYYPLGNGTYLFQATYNGDGNYLTATSNITTEPLVVTATTSEIDTYLNATTITLGSTVYDTANVTFPVSIPPYPVPTGSISFSVKLIGGTWESLGNVVGTWDSSNNRFYANSAEFTPNQTGTYYFNATYSGDGNYTGSHEQGNSDTRLEKLVVTNATPIVTTQLNATLITLGAGVTDTVTVTGLGIGFPVPTGTVQFTVQWPNLTVTNLGTPVTLDAFGMATSIPFTPPFTGSYLFNATYSGDSNYNAASDAIAYQNPELLIVARGYVTVTTQLNALTINFGQSTTDTVTVTGLGGIFPIPTGSVQFIVNGSNLGSAVNLDASGMATSPVFTPTQVGTYYFTAEYSGDGNYTGSTSQITVDETLTVGPGTPTVETRINGSVDTIQSVLGDQFNDEAIVTGFDGVTPTGTVMFFLYCPNGTTINFDNEPLVDGVAYSSYVTLNPAGFYYFSVWYTGDGNYTGQVSYAESFTVGPGTVLITTLLNTTWINLGQSVSDSVTFVGVQNGYPVPTGTVEFQNNDTGVWVTFDTEPLSNGMATSGPFTPTHAGKFFFRAWFDGDTNYMPTGSCPFGEPLRVYPPLPTIETILSNGAPTIGDAVYDTATLTGYGSLSLAGANIQFWYMAPGGQWAPLGSPQLVTNAAGGTFTSIYLMPNIVGNWFIKANYTGNANYWPGESGVELIQVQQDTPTVTTYLSATNITIGESIYDNVTVTGLGGNFPVPTGTVHFQNNDTGVWVTFDNETLSNGMATSQPFYPSHTGIFFFRAVYDGDSTYTTAQSGKCIEIVMVYPEPIGYID